MTFALIYHDLARRGEADSYGFSGPAAARYKLEPIAFEAHLDAIEEAGVRVGLVYDAPQATLTFDDGGASAVQAAAALERRGWRGHFFVTTGRIGTAGFLDREAIADLLLRGHDIGSHSHSHPTYMGRLTRQQLSREWRESADVLGGILGAPPRAAAVPGGFLSLEVVEEAAAAGYRLLMTSQPGSSPRWHGAMRVYGRYAIWASTAPGRAAAYARGDRRARASMWIAWQAKMGPKRISPRGYEAVRQMWARYPPWR